MSPENDQTKWRGIRPTNPPEDIPVDVVRPAGTISDLQAIEVEVAKDMQEANKNCSVSYTIGSAAVPANKLWVITNMSIENEISLCDMIIQAQIGAVPRTVKAFYSIPPNIMCSWDGIIVLNATDFLVARYELGGVTDDINFWIHGYQIGIY